MGKEIAGLEAAYRGLFTAALIVLALLVILCLIRAIIGPRIADRIVSVNMMGTMVIVIIAILTVMLGEGYLADICIIYAMISFLAVIVLTKVYMGVYMENKAEEKKEAGKIAETCDKSETESRSEAGSRSERKSRSETGNRSERVDRNDIGEKKETPISKETGVEENIQEV